jgi:elongation factor G
MTRGAGSYTLTIDGYEEAPMDVQKKLIEAYKASRE